MTESVVIAGAGLAGACAALALARTHRVTVLDDGRPGASHAAAGLVNPFLGRKAKRAWRATEALAEVARLGATAGAPVELGGLLRPARDEAQAAVFRERAAEHPDALDWLPAEASRERFAEVRAPHGALWVREGGHVEIPALVRAVLRAAEADGVEVIRARLEGWTSASAAPGQPTRGLRTQILPVVSSRAFARDLNADTRAVRDGAGRAENVLRSFASAQDDTAQEDAPDRSAVEIETDRLLLCTGDGTRALAPGLPLHRVKGQTVRLGLASDVVIPPVSGGTYVVPLGSREVVVGATFEHDFETLAPTPEATERLRQRAAEIVPALAEAEVLEARAGVRLTVPASVRPGRLPLVGPIAPGVWVFAGLGAKGLLTAPLLARHLPAWWDAPEAIWPDIATGPLRHLTRPPG